MREAFLRSADRLVRGQTGWVLIGALIVSLLSFLLVRGLPLKSGFLDLFPPRDPLLERFREREEVLQQADTLAVLLALRQPAVAQEDGVAQLAQAGERLIAALLQNEEIAAASYKRDLQVSQTGVESPAEVLLTQLRTYGERIRATLLRQALQLPGEKGLVEVYREINDLIESAMSRTLEFRGLEVDPKQVAEAIQKLRELNETVRQELEQLPAQVGAAQEELRSLLDALSAVDRALQQTQALTQTPNLSRDGQALLVTVRPRYSSQRGLEYNRQIVQFVRAAVAATGLEADGFSVNLSGTYVTSVEIDEVIRQDMQTTALVASAGVGLLFILIFRTITYPLLAMIPLFLALSLTLAWARISVGSLNLLTSFLPSLILGVGINYAIYLLSRYLEEWQEGVPSEQALSAAVLERGAAMWAAAVTTAAVFIAMASSKTRGLLELGVIGGGGILLYFLVTILVLPALITAYHRLRERRARAYRYGVDLEPFLRGVTRWRRAILVLIVLASIPVAWQASRVDFKFVSSDLVPQNLPSRAAQQRIAEAFEASGTEAVGEYFVFFAKDPDELRRITHELGDVAGIQAVYSLASFAPQQLGTEQQLLQLGNLTQQLEQGRQGLDAIAQSLGERALLKEQLVRLVKNLSHLQSLAVLYGQSVIAVELGDLVTQLRAVDAQVDQLPAEQLVEAVGELKRGLNQVGEQLLRLSGLGPSAQEDVIETILKRLPPGLRARFATSRGEHIVYARLQRGILATEESYQAFLERVSRVASDFFGAPMIQRTLEQYLERDFRLSTALAGLIILVFLWVGFRRSLLRGAWLYALSPLALGYLWMLGWMNILGIPFNFANVIISPLLIGVGVDNGIYLLYRHLEDRRQGRALATTAVAVLAASLTAMMSFGSLLLARVPGLHLLGASAIIGLGFTLVFSLVLVPVLMSFAQPQAAPARPKP